MIPTLILSVLDHHSVLCIIIKSLAHTQTQGQQKTTGHILSFKKLLHSFDMKLQSFKDL